MGAPCALWVALTLLEAVKGQTQPSPPAVTPVLESFQEDKFQGAWFVLGLAGSGYGKADKSVLSPFTATFERDGRSRLAVSYAMTRGRRCLTWSYVLTPTAQPGNFLVTDSGVPGASLEEMQVHDTNYTSFALTLSRRQSGSWPIVRIHLLCRKWAIETQVLDRFVCLARAQGLSQDGIVFPDVTDWTSYSGTC